MSALNDAHTQDGASANGTSQVEPAKPITVMLPDDTVKRLKIIAVVRGTPVSELVAEAAVAVVRRELRKALAKIALE